MTVSHGGRRRDSVYSSHKLLVTYYVVTRDSAELRYSDRLSSTLPVTLAACPALSEDHDNQCGHGFMLNSYRRKPDSLAT